jgi:hypothetical protein
MCMASFTFSTWRLRSWDSPKYYPQWWDVASGNISPNPPRYRSIKYWQLSYSCFESLSFQW